MGIEPYKYGLEDAMILPGPVPGSYNSVKKKLGTHDDLTGTGVVARMLFLSIRPARVDGGESPAFIE